MTVLPFPVAARRSPPVDAMMARLGAEHLRDVLDGKSEGLAVVSISTLLIVLDRLDEVERRGAEHNPTRKREENQ